MVEQWAGLILLRREKLTLVLGLKSRWVVQWQRGMGQWRGYEEVVRGAKAKLQNRGSRRQSFFFFFFAFVFDLGFSVFKKYLFVDPKLIYYTDESVKDYYYFQK